MGGPDPVNAAPTQPSTLQRRPLLDAPTVHHLLSHAQAWVKQFREGHDHWQALGQGGVRIPVAASCQERGANACRHGSGGRAAA